MSELDQVVDAWAQSMAASVAIGETLTEADWQRPTECPEWTVKDVYAHLVGGELWMSEGHPPPPQGLARIADEPVRDRRDHPGPRVLAELRAVLADRRRQLAAAPPDPDAPAVTAYLQPVTVGVLYRMRAFDAWVHEQDIRRAVDPARPGNLDSGAARISHTIFLGGLPRVVAKLAAAPPGSVVRLSVTGPIAFEQAIVVGADGRGQLLAEPPAGAGTPTVGLATDWETFTRLMAGRIPPESAKIDITGDTELAARILAHLAITP